MRFKEIPLYVAVCAVFAMLLTGCHPDNPDKVWD